MRGHTWKKMEEKTAEEIKSLLLEKGGAEKIAKGTHEVWRIKFSDSTFTYYQTGTLFSTPPNTNDSAVFEAWEMIDSLAGPSYFLPEKDFLIGLDETGKGELLGHTILAGVAFPRNIFHRIDLLLGPADTKKRHIFQYWDDIFRNIDYLKNLGLYFCIERIPPWQLDKYNLNKIMDITYQRILSIFLRKAEISQCRIVLDDYGIGGSLTQFLNFLKRQGAEVVVTTNAEDTYLEAKTASLISKRTREAVMKVINENPEFIIDGLSVGSGNAADPKTLQWLKKWHESGKEWPWFIKRSFKTIGEIEKKTVKLNKADPPIRDDLLSEEFTIEFNKGNLSVESLSIVCPYCGEIHKAILYAMSRAKCPSCERFISNVSMTLRFYCGYVVPDSSIIRRGLLSKDLENKRFFQDFTIVISPIVRKECETSGGRKEFNELAKFASMGRVRLEEPGKIEEIPDGLSNIEHDERIIQYALDYNGILLTADNTMKAHSIAKNIFTIFA